MFRRNAPLTRVIPHHIAPSTGEPYEHEPLDVLVYTATHWAAFRRNAPLARVIPHHIVHAVSDKEHARAVAWQ